MPKIERTFEEEVDFRLARFTAVMREKLIKNKGRGLMWDGDNKYRLFERMMEESGELHSAMWNGEPPENVASECADVANFAMMVADVAAFSKMEDNDGH